MELAFEKQEGQVCDENDVVPALPEAVKRVDLDAATTSEQVLIASSQKALEENTFMVYEHEAQYVDSKEDDLILCEEVLMRRLGLDVENAELDATVELHKD